MIEKFQRTLMDYGLSGKESKIYLTLLFLGSTTANKLAEKSGIMRTTTYDVLKTLREKGMASSVTQNKTLYFQAINPEKLIHILEEKKKKIKSILPELKKIKIKPTDLPTTELYKGKEGIKRIFQEILIERKPTRAFSNTHFVFQVAPFYVPHFIKERAKAGIHIKLLNEKTKESINLMKKRDKQELRETRFVQKLRDIPVTEYIFGDNVAFINTKPEEPLGVIVRNKDFANAQKLLFDLLWGNAER